MSRQIEGKTVLVIDGGGRGAALVDAYARSRHVGRILAVPGNDLMGVNTDKPVKTYPRLKTTNIKEVLRLCRDEQVNLVDVAQDNAVEAGLVDVLKKKGVSTVGSTRLAGQIEWDKYWSRKFNDRHGIPQPAYKVCQTQEEGWYILTLNRTNPGL